MLTMQASRSLLSALELNSANTFLKTTTPTLSHSPLDSRRRHFSSSKASSAAEQDHYNTLGISRSASKKEIRDRFYELSKKYHPDAPSVSSESVETRTARFQTLSQSYSVLSDETSRRQYDSSLSGTGYGSSRPRYTSGSAHEVGRSGFGGGSAAAWSSGENHARRERANYAWSHPARRRNPDAAQHAAHSRDDPFASTRRDSQRSSDEMFQTFAAREARLRGRMMNGFGTSNATPGSRFASGTASFGAKAEEESRLINDSSTKRSGQVFFVFAATFFIAWSLSGHDRNAVPAIDRRKK